MTERNYDVHFTLSLMQKDLSYAIAEGRQFSVPLETAGAALHCFERACAEGLGLKDLSAVVEPLRNG
jgi:3-hydroxyisobutyrate dehydrogenase-like beta-hydroxyacid dehydrogenase